MSSENKPTEGAEPVDPGVTIGADRADETPGGQQPVLVRRAPRLAPRLLVGAVIGIVVALAIGLAVPSSAEVSRMQAAGYLLLWFVPAGVAVAGLLHVWADARSRRGAARATAVTLVEHPLPENSTESDNPSNGQEQ